MENDFRRSSFDDIVFEGRNKEYGAYQLRKKETRDIYIALFLGIFILSSVVFGPLVYAKYFGKKKAKGPSSTEVATDLTLANIKKVEKKSPVKKTEIKVQMEKFVRYEPKIDNQVMDQDPPPDSLLLRSLNLGYTSQKGDSSDYFEPSGDVGGGPPGPPDDEVFTYVDELAYYKPGNFDQYVADNYVMTEAMQTKGKPGVLFISFTVEKDGTLSNIKVLVGKGLSPMQDAEAIRVLKLTSGKWEPAKINATPVRSIHKQKFTFNPEDFY